MAIKLGDEVAVPANVLADLRDAANNKPMVLAPNHCGSGKFVMRLDGRDVATTAPHDSEEHIQRAIGTLIVHKVNAYNALVVTLQNLLRECEVAAVDLRPRRAGPMRAKMRHARQVLDDIGEADV